MATQSTLERSHNAYPSSEGMFEEEFPSSTLLIARSPISLVRICGHIALLLAVHGLVAESVNFFEIGDKFSPGIENSLQLAASGIYYAYDAVSIWQSNVPDEHKTNIYLTDLNKDPHGQWENIVIGPAGYPPLSVGEKGLIRLLMYVNGDQKERFAYPLVHYPYRVCLLFLGDVRSMAIDFAVRRGHDAEAERLLVGQGTDPTYVAKSRSAWKLLKDGRMFSQANAEEARLRISVWEIS
jgi:hypothetical protein